MFTDPTRGKPVSTISGRLTKSSGPSGSFDDIPVALRAKPPRSTRRWLKPLLAASGLSVAIGAGVLTLSEPFRSWLIPPAVVGLDQKPDPDGRLLGHFPYAEVSESELVELEAGQRLHRDAAREWLAMQEAAYRDGVDLRLLSAFRSVDDQTSIFFDVKSERNQTARDRARVSAPPGYSEHSTGYAIDVGDANAPGADLSTGFEQTEGYDWLRAHAQRYHFALSFPRGNRQGVSYEPWHWRFEGTATALKVFEPAGRFALR